MALMEIWAGRRDDEHLLLPMQKLHCCVVSITTANLHVLGQVAGQEQVARAQPKMDQVGF